MKRDVSSAARASMLLMCLAALAPHVMAQARLQIIASGIGAQNQAGNLSLGHTFMIISVPTRTGIKEEAFGFYEDRMVNNKAPTARSGDPKKIEVGPTENEMKNGKDPSVSRMIVGFPGALNSEFRRNPDRLAKAAVSFEMPINADQRHAVYEAVVRWNEHKYALMSSNCIDFINNVAQAVGLPRVYRAPGQTPEAYVGLLKSAYDQKLKLDRILAEETRLENERKDAEAKAEAEALRIPTGWVACWCPAQHEPYGKYVRGILYHPNNLACH